MLCTTMHFLKISLLGFCLHLPLRLLLLPWSGAGHLSGGRGRGRQSVHLRTGRRLLPLHGTGGRDEGHAAHHGERLEEERSHAHSDLGAAEPGHRPGGHLTGAARLLREGHGL